MANGYGRRMGRGGAAPIVVVDLQAERGGIGRHSGADIVVTDPSEVEAAVKNATDGRGADMVVESVGLPALYAQAFDLIRPGGHVAAFGLTGPDETVPLGILDTVLKENSVKGSVAGMGEDMHDAMTLLLHGRFELDAFTGNDHSLADIQSAFDGLADHPEALKTQIVL